MAAVGTHSFQRFDGKLDCILRKTLTGEEYERISITESCIVVNDEGKRSQKLVTLGHNALYFTNIPPKTVIKVLDLTQIVSCNTINDVPDFLSTTERHNVHHIKIQYIDDNHRCRSTSPFKRSASLPNKQTGRSITGLTRSIASMITKTHGATPQTTRWYDIYILQGRHHVTQFNHHLHVVLEDVLMESLSMGNSCNEYHQQSIAGQYESLKIELTGLDNVEQDYDHIAALLVELKQGMDKYHVLKRVYWGDLQLMEYLVHTTQRSCTIRNQCDRIEYCVIVSEVVFNVMYQSYLLLNRTTLILQDSGRLIDELIRSFITIIEESSNSKNKEVIELCGELSCNIAAISNEIFRLIQQISWLIPNTVCEYNEGRLCDTILKHNGVVPFMSRLTNMICSHADSDQCNLILYQSLCFIEKCLTHSNEWTLFIRKHFREEFQYILINNSQKTINDKLNNIRRKVL